MEKNNEKDLSFLQKQLVFYGSYHSNSINILVHVIFVPIILWTSLVIFSKVGPFFTFPLFGYLIEINLATLLSFAYTIYYLYLELFAGMLYAPILLYMGYSSTVFQHQNPNAVGIALGIHVLGWIAQFASHGYAEKRAPALFDGIKQAFSLAPLFVFLEILFFIGYKPNYKERVDFFTSKEVGKFIASKLKQKKSS